MSTTMPLYMPIFKSCTTTATLHKLHATLIVSGLHRSPLAATKLIQHYSNSSNITAAALIFNIFPSPDSFMCAVMLKAYTKNHRFKHSLTLYHTMQQHGLDLSCYVFPPVLRACAALRDVNTGMKLQGRAVKQSYADNAAVQTSLIQMYSAVGRLDDACMVFDGMLVRDVVSWSAMVSGCVQCGEAEAGLEMLGRMNDEGVGMDSVAMMHVARACGELGLRRQARAVHGLVIRKLAGMDESLENSLISMYGECGDFDSSEKVLQSASCRSVVSWNAMISCYNRRSCYKEALVVITRMQEAGVDLNAVTMMSVLDSCSQLGCVREGRSVHGFIVRRGEADSQLCALNSAIMKFYASAANIANCVRVFETAQLKTLLLWNSLIAAYAQNGSPDKALMLFDRMRKEMLPADSFTLLSVLLVCTHIGDCCLGAQIHGLITKSCYQHYSYVQNSLIDMYCKCGSAETAYSVFSELEWKDIVTWNTMIGGFSQNGSSEAAVRLFKRMHYEGNNMDAVTFLSAIRACSNLGSFGKGRCIHQQLTASGLKETRIYNALIAMYANCGDIEMSRRVFDSISEKNVVSWNSIISGYRSHGLADEAIALFSEMVTLGVRPNGVTFLSVLSACNHARLVKIGMHYFNMMSQDFGIEPQLDHCACMVDLLSHAGQTLVGFDLIKSMPAEPNASTWRALLNGYNINHRKGIVGHIER